MIELFFVILLFIAVTLFAGVRIVPQGWEYVVERLGKYHGTLRPGLNIVIPYMDRVAYKVLTKDQPIEVDDLEAITKDNAVVVVNAISFIKVSNPQEASYGVQNYVFAIQNLVMTTLRAIIGGMEIDEALSNRETIKSKLKEAVSHEIAGWGITVKSAEVRDIRPSQSMQKAMEMQAAAERTRRATITEAEGNKQAAILQAEGKLEAARREADAQIALAKASSDAIKEIAAAIGDREPPAMFLLGDRYIKVMHDLSASGNSKLIVLPPDIKGAIRGLLGKV